METEKNYLDISEKGKAPIKAWVKGFSIEQGAEQQLKNVASMPFIHKHIAVMPDVHWGIGATVGSVIPSIEAIIPAAVGVDIGCGMIAVQTSLKASDLPESLKQIRAQIEKAVPHGRTNSGGPGDRGAWLNIPASQSEAWSEMKPAYDRMIAKHPQIDRNRPNHANHLGTLGTGNHFIEVCLDETDHVWFMLHSGSRGIGNRIGSYFIDLAKQDMRKHRVNLPDENLAYLKEGAEHFDDYVEAVEWAQNFAKKNRELMMNAVIEAVKKSEGIPPFTYGQVAVNCHHNYVSKEFHFGKEVYLTRKGAVRARQGDMGIIPGSMGARSYIVRGLGNEDSFHSCSHGAGRLMSRSEAKRRFTLDEHIEATKAVECRKDRDVLDETPGAYKPIDKVMEAQKDLVEVVHTLRQVVCVKG
jgi:tRNA-splicing ligase RtcB (3'-phosphate/5'-hydroxy nucleic acid ligase)